MKLTAANLSKLPKQVIVPTYDRTALKTGIVHVGIGGFHRAHQAYYTDNLLQNHSIRDWGICGIALLPSDKKIFQTLRTQDGLYTLVIKELDGSLSIRVIGSIVEFLFAPANPTAVIEKMAHPDTKIITLTITEGGYNFDDATGAFNSANPLVQQDILQPTSPQTIFGYLTQSFKLRKERGLNGCTIQSCDNIQGNGDVSQKMVLTYISLAEPELVDWVKANVSFPNSMVDRITPVTRPTDIDFLKEQTGIEDLWPVVCEPFLQWVIEEEFSVGRPPWEKVGAQFVEEVAPYERMKLSLLNAGHSVVGILGALLGYSTIDEAVKDTAIRAFLIAFLDKEVTPSLGDLAGVNLGDYKASLIERFGNPHIKDQVARICSQSSAKLPKFLLPTPNYQLQQNGPIAHTAFLIAAWAIYNLGEDEKGNPLIIDDAKKELLAQKAIAAQDDPVLFLQMPSIFGELAQSDRFVQAYLQAYERISKRGIVESLAIHIV